MENSHYTRNMHPHGYLALRLKRGLNYPAASA